jgi:hypothetical protein
MGRKSQSTEPVAKCRTPFVTGVNSKTTRHVPVLMLLPPVLLKGGRVRSGGGVEVLVVSEVGVKDRAKRGAMGQRTPVVAVVRCENMEQHKRRKHRTKGGQRNAPPDLPVIDVRVTV